MFIFSDFLHVHLFQFSHAAVSQEVGRRSTSEDSRMMAFFDALVQRDIAGLSEDDIRQQIDELYPDGYYDYKLGQSYEDKYYEEWSRR